SWLSWLSWLSAAAFARAFLISHNVYYVQARSGNPVVARLMHPVVACWSGRPAPLTQGHGACSMTHGNHTWNGWRWTENGRYLVSPDGDHMTAERLRGLAWRDAMELRRAGYASRRKAEAGTRARQYGAKV